MGTEAATLKQTPLHALHRELGARMVSFAGYDMPVQYPAGIIAEHRHARDAAGLFDVSHMGQAWLEADDDAGAAFEALVPSDIRGLAPGAMRYTLLLNEAGGIRDDLIATRLDADRRRLFLVVNAACKEADFGHIAGALGGRARLSPVDDRALLALQGPRSTTVLARLNPAVAELAFMTMTELDLAGTPCQVSRSGYTGEDGFEISLPAAAAAAFARGLLEAPEVEPIGLGARDSLRLEAGLCLYGHDINTTTTPVEAGLLWTIAKHRREPADFPAVRRSARSWPTALGGGGSGCCPRAGYRARGYRDHRCRRPVDRRRDQRRLRSECRGAGGDGLCGDGPRRAGHRGDARRARQAGAGARRQAAVRGGQLLSRHLTPATGGGNERNQLHRGP